MLNSTKQWYLWGYILTFTEGNLWFGGDRSKSVFREDLIGNTGLKNSPIPEMVYALYQGMFAAFT